MDTLKYVVKRLLLMVLTFFIIMTMLFFLIRLLPNRVVAQPGSESYIAEVAWREAWGLDKPIIVQYGIFLKNLITKFDWGTSFKSYPKYKVVDIVAMKLPPTILVNLYSILFSIPIGLLLGAFAALKKNKWQDQIISVLTMVIISVPSYVYAALVQYILCYKLGWFPLVVNSGEDYLSWSMFYSMLPAVLALCFGTIAGFTRTTRAELTEVLTGEYMLLARTKGLTRWQATIKHAFRNAMVIILPMIIGEFISILGGSLIIENQFAVPGIGGLYIKSINEKDYNIFLFVSMFYVFIGLLASIVIDISYGFIDPRIRIGGRK